MISFTPISISDDGEKSKIRGQLQGSGVFQVNSLIGLLNILTANDKAKNRSKLITVKLLQIELRSPILNTYSFKIEKWSHLYLRALVRMSEKYGGLIGGEKIENKFRRKEGSEYVPDFQNIGRKIESTF